MDTKKIGSFIAQCRREAGMTQAQLGEKLGVTNKTISRWETSMYMPDISLLQPLCQILHITLNELFAGERQNPLSEDASAGELPHTTDMPGAAVSHSISGSSEEILNGALAFFLENAEKRRRVQSALVIGFGVLLILSGFFYFDKESSWSALSVIAGLLTVSGVAFHLLIGKSVWKRLGTSCGIFLCGLLLLFAIDYAGVRSVHRPPVFHYLKTTETGPVQLTSYYCPFYTVYRVNAHTPNEYYIVDTGKTYTRETLPISPFNRDKSGIDNLLSCKNDYIGNNSNIGRLLSALPLSEYGLVFSIDSDARALTVDYSSTSWYPNSDLYIYKSLLYNSVCIFSLIGNAEQVTYNFVGDSYTIERQTVENTYPGYDLISRDSGNNSIDKEAFQELVEKKMLDNEFVQQYFSLMFGDKAGREGNQPLPSQPSK